ncbi:hypothetical protein [uncultured Rubinisphaera sp.]|uniref:hypothetical protein n=1 Tax=uncultured Rubinisphaera sp. TaxID=1678686 RepID=UPI0030D9DB39
MESLFTWCAVLGGTIFAVQFVMLLIGLDGSGDLDFDAPDLDVPDLEAPEIGEEAAVGLRDAEVDFDHHSLTHSDGWFVGIVTFRSLVAATAVFGLTGRGVSEHLPPGQAFAVAALAGFGMLYMVGWSFKKLYQLKADGTVRISAAKGCTGNVYLTIPENNTGPGKVTVSVANRTMEYRAITQGEQLKTGTPIVVTNVISEDTVEVVSEVSVSAVNRSPANSA